MKRTHFEKAIAFIAEEDEPNESDKRVIADQISVQMASAMFDKHELEIALEVLLHRAALARIRRDEKAVEKFLLEAR